MAKLKQKQRDQIPAKHYAVPETEQLPIEDEVHTKMAWNMVDKTKGLSSEQRESARKKILRRAKELGMDTSGWNIPENLQGEIDEQVDYDDNVEHEMEKEQEEHEMHGQAVVFSALAMEIPDQVSDHPNQTPFKGVLTRLDEPSDNPLNGSSGKCVILPKAVAEKALSSLLGMGIDATHNLDGHDVKNKIGLITAATIVGNAIHIEGFFYGADFPDEIKRIQAEKSQLGFSYEAQAHIRSMNDDPLVIKNCVFTGAAVLYKDKAAYTSTSLSATKNSESNPMTPEEKKMFEDMQTQIASLSQELSATKDKIKLSGGSVAQLVKPHADALRSCAANMAAAGIGMHSKSGHVAVLHNMADNMEAAAAMGQMPHIYQTGDFYHAGAEKEKLAASKKEEVNEEMKKLTEVISELTTKVTDLEKAKFSASAEPERKTISPAIKSLLVKAGIGTENDEKLSVSEIDKHLAKAPNLTIAQRIHAKVGLQTAGKIG